MRFITVKVTRDTNSSHAGDVAPWELPILDFMHGEGNVQRVGETFTSTELPEAAEEFNRLVTRYGMDNETGIANTAQVYGQARVGVKALGDEIEKERVSERAREKAEADALAA
jgi:hypothetical protein